MFPEVCPPKGVGVDSVLFTLTNSGQRPCLGTLIIGIGHVQVVKIFSKAIDIIYLPLCVRVIRIGRRGRFGVILRLSFPGSVLARISVRWQSRSIARNVVNCRLVLLTTPGNGAPTREHGPPIGSG